MRRPIIPILLLAVAAFLWSQHSLPIFLPTGRASTHSIGSAGSSSDALPPEASDTLTLIRQGGPFPHHQDGVVFQNREHRLPNEAYGYYHEYTVPTPGAHDRGARRIITGGDPPSAYYYTDDHYQSFRALEATR